MYKLVSDVDECMEETDRCAENATCVNYPGNYTCNCTEGFIVEGFSCIGR